MGIAVSVDRGLRVPSIFNCDEKNFNAPNIISTMKKIKNIYKKWSLVVGPEGGFTAKERDHILKTKRVYPITLGKRILRSDTAATVVLFCLQQFVENQLFFRYLLNSQLAVKIKINTDNITSTAMLAPDIPWTTQTAHLVYNAFVPKKDNINIINGKNNSNFFIKQSHQLKLI